jgi:hypothetical protein
VRDALSSVPHTTLEPTTDKAGVIIDGIEVATNQDLDFTAREQNLFEQDYTRALFQIPEVGRISPVIKTRFGYHVVLWTDVKPAEDIDYTKAESILHPLLQRKSFRDWVEQLKKSHDVEGPYFDRLPVDQGAP